MATKSEVFRLDFFDQREEEFIALGKRESQVRKRVVYTSILMRQSD